jgi:hypothetical protein
VSSPTARTLALLRAEGFTAQAVERYCHHSRRRVDLFGIIDVVAVHGDRRGVLGVQTTSASTAAARLTKAKSEPALRAWWTAGNGFEVWSWGRRGPKGKRKVWACRRRPLTLEDLEGACQASKHGPGGS